MKSLLTMMKKIILLFMLLYLASGNATSLGPPGKPTLTNCRSPEKETFTCWWKPGPDGGLPTTYTLFYLKDDSDILYECPDYHTAGKNSCFFNKNETSVWVNYNITVVATNEIGRTFSDSVDVDVAYIVQPHTPENVTVTVMEDKGWPFLRVSWESPHKADIRSGWITLVYALRSKMEGEEEWEEHFPGQQKTFNIFSIRSGSSYEVQVRCKPDHGFWSEWTSTTKIKVPEYFFREKSLWIIIAVFSFIAFVTLAWILYLNSQSLKQCILPPVPGPKIKGFDQQCLKDGSYKDGLHSLMIPEFPASYPSNYEDLLVEYLEVSVNSEQELSSEAVKDMQNHCDKSERSTCDSDSGRGSCDSHTLLTEKHKEVKKDKVNMDLDKSTYQDSANTCNGRVKTWPCLLQSPSGSTPQKSSLKAAKRHCLSDTSFPHGLLLPSDNQNQSWRSDFEDTIPCIKQSDEIYLPDINTCQLTNERHSIFTPSQYVEVQTVNEENMIVLKSVESVQGQYSKVNGLCQGNTLLLKRGSSVTGAVLEECFYAEIESNSLKDYDKESGDALKHQDASVSTSTMPDQEQKPLANGYVDTAMVFSVSM